MCLGAGGDFDEELFTLDLISAASGAQMSGDSTQESVEPPSGRDPATKTSASEVRPFLGPVVLVSPFSAPHKHSPHRNPEVLSHTEMRHATLQHTANQGHRPASTEI